LFRLLKLLNLLLNQISFRFNIFCFNLNNNWFILFIFFIINCQLRCFLRFLFHFFQFSYQIRFLNWFIFVYHSFSLLNQWMKSISFHVFNNQDLASRVKCNIHIRYLQMFLKPFSQTTWLLLQKINLLPFMLFSLFISLSFLIF
jgi:hypothetical protein